MLTPVKKPRSASRFHVIASENVDPNLLSPAPPPSRRKPTKSPASSKAASKPKKSTTSASITLKKTFCEVVDEDSAIEKKKKKKKTEDEAKRTRDEKTDGVAEVEEAVAAEDRQLEGRSETMKMRRMLKEAMSRVPDSGAGRVLYLVKTFERLLSINSQDPDGDGADIEGAEDNSKAKLMNWALPGLQQHLLSPPKAEVSETFFSFDDSSSSSDYERDSDEESSIKENRLSYGSVESDERGNNKRNSSGSLKRSWNKSLKVTSQQPFKLRTEQRGRFKEEHFMNKVKEMLLGEEKKRIPMAQGLPWTTDEPECLMKPPVKQPTEPIDVILRSHVRAVERAEFDFHVAERISFVEQIKLESERQQKLEEDEEIKRLRRELVPRAQPMPYFDHPFVPKKSTKPKTASKDPSLHL